MRGRHNMPASGWLAAAMLLAAGCASKPGEQGLYQRLQSNEEGVLAQAVVEAGCRADDQAVPYLIDALEHDAADVRLFAIASLRRITGQDLGYRHWAQPEDRQAAVQRWRMWRQAACADELCGE